MAEEGLLKGIYKGIEDSYYGFCDFLQNQLKIPVYDAFVTPIESRGIPSLPFFFMLLLAIAGVGYYGFAMFNQGSTTLKVSVIEAGSPLANVGVTLEIDGKEFKTMSSDSDGLAVFENVPVGRNANVKINQAGYEEFSKTFTVGKTNPEISASLQASGTSPNGGSKVRVTIKVRDSDGVPLGGATVAYFDSESGNYEQELSDATGLVTLLAQNSNSELSLTVSKSNYQTARSSVIVSDQNSQTVTLEKKVTIIIDDGGTKTAKGTVLVSVQDSEGEPVDANVQLHLMATDEILKEERSMDAGKVKFKDVDAVGAKVYIVVKPRDTGKYLVYDGSADAALLTEEAPLEFRATVDSKEKARDYNITLTITDTGKAPIQGATIKAYNVETNARITSPILTDASGKVMFPSNKVVYVTIMKDGYLPTFEPDLAAGDSKTIHLEKSTDENTGAIKVTVLDADGTPAEGAKVNIKVEESFFFGINEGTTYEDGTVTFSKVPLEMRGEQARYVAVASKDGVSGTSSIFVLDSGETKEIVAKLAQAKGNAVITLKDATNQKAIQAGKVAAFLRSTDEKISDSECTFTTGACTIPIPANKQVYFKITSASYLDLETEDLVVNPSESKAMDALMIPAALKNQLLVSFDGIADVNGNQSFSRNFPALGKGAFYLAKFTLNIPANSEKAGMFVKIGGSDPTAAKDDYAAISNIVIPTDAVTTKGFTYKPSASCKSDIIAQEDAGNSRFKWANLEFVKSAGTKAVVVKMFISPSARQGDPVSIGFRGYAISGKVFTRTPDDEILGNGEKGDGKDWCYANLNSTSMTISEGRFDCNDKVCVSMQFSSGDAKVSKGFAAEYNKEFKAYIAIRALKDFGNSPYVKISDDAEVKFGRYDFAGSTGSAGSKGTQMFSLENMNAGDSVSGEISAVGTIPSTYSKIYLEFGDADGAIKNYMTPIQITGTNEFSMQVVPSELLAGEDKNLNVMVLNSVDDSPITDATVKIEEDETSVFDGATPDSINGDGADQGAEGKYVFKGIHPFNTGSFNVIAQRQGFKDGQKTANVTLNDFLEAGETSMRLSCDQGTLDVSNLLNSKVTALARSTCLQIGGEGIDRVGSGTNAAFEIKAKGKVSLILTPIKSGSSCDLNIDGTSGSAHANLRVPIQVSCDNLGKTCTTSAQCNSGEDCVQGICTSTAEASPSPTIAPDVPDSITISLDENYRADLAYSLAKLVSSGGSVTGCDIASSEPDQSLRIQNFVDVTCTSGTLSISADYSDAPFYTKASAAPYSEIRLADDTLAKIQNGILYIKFSNAPTKSIAVVVNGPPKQQNQTGSGQTIYITANGFEPNSIHVDLNTKVTWVNKDTANRNVVSIADLFHSDSIAPGQSFPYTFSKAGVYNYRDSTRSSIKGVIYVGDFDTTCKYKNANYFAQRFVGHLTNSLVNYFDPNNGKAAQVAYSSVYKFYVTPSGITARAQEGLAPPQVMGYGFNPYTTQYNPYDPRFTQFINNQNNQFGMSTYSGAQDQKICDQDGNAGFKCKIYISPLLPVNGAAFSIINDYAIMSGSPTHILVDKDNSKFDYLAGAYADKQGVSGWIIGALQGLDKLFDIAPRYTTFVLTNDPAKIAYTAEGSDVKIHFADGSDHVSQNMLMKIGPAGQVFTIKMDFYIDNRIGKYALLRVPASTEIYARNGGKAAVEPYYIINNIPTTELSLQNGQAGQKQFSKVTYFTPNLDGIAPLTVNLKRKIGTDVALTLPLAAPKIISSQISYDVVGNKGKDAVDDKDTFGCSKNGFCISKEDEDTTTSIQNEILEFHDKIKVQRLDYAGFGDYAAQKYAEALTLTFMDYAADKTQYELCKGVQAIQGGVCTGKVSGGSDYNCYDSAYCDNFISGGELWSTEKEMLGKAVCNTEFYNNFEAIASSGNWDVAKGMMMRNLMNDPQFMPRIQYTKPIVGTDRQTVTVIMKRTAESGSTTGYVLKEFYPFKIENGGGSDGFITLDQALTHDTISEAQRDADKKAQDAAIKAQQGQVGKAGVRFQGIALNDWKTSDPQYFYLKDNVPLLDTGKPNLYTMNKYPFDFSGDKLGIFDDVIKALVLNLPNDPRAIKVISCNAGFKQMVDYEGAEIANGSITYGYASSEYTSQKIANPCTSNELDPNEVDDYNIKGTKAIIRYKPQQKQLIIVNALETSKCLEPHIPYALTSENCKLVEGTPSDSFTNVSTAILKAALKYLLDEKDEGKLKIDGSDTTLSAITSDNLQGLIWAFALDRKWASGQKATEKVTESATATQPMVSTQPTTNNYMPEPKTLMPSITVFSSGTQLNCRSTDPNLDVDGGKYYYDVDPNKQKYTCIRVVIDPAEQDKYSEGTPTLRSIKAGGEAGTKVTIVDNHKFTNSKGFTTYDVTVNTKDVLGKRIWISVQRDDGLKPAIGRFWFPSREVTLREHITYNP